MVVCRHLDASTPRWSGVKDHAVIASVHRGSLCIAGGGGRLFVVRCGEGALLGPGVLYDEVERSPDVAAEVVVIGGAAARTAFGTTHILRGQDAEALQASARALTRDATTAARVLADLVPQRPWLSPEVEAVLVRMNDHLDQPLRISTLAQELGLNRHRLTRLFGRQVGLAPYTYLTQLRIARARTLLAGGHPPSDVALRVGYCDQSQFHRHFRRIVGETPGRYQRRAQLP